MKYLIDYVKAHGGRVETKVSLPDDTFITIISVVNEGGKLDIHDEFGNYIGEKDFELQDWLYDNYEAEIRFCDYCGGPMQEGMSDDEGDFFEHTECFPKAMDENYSPGNWREMPQDDPENPVENCRGGYYEYRESEDSEWEPEGSYYTEWY